LPMREKIGQMIRKGDIMIFMNGNFDVQMCYKSKAIVQLIRNEKYDFVKDSIATFDLT
jgi:glutaredoxin-related protein